MREFIRVSRAILIFLIIIGAGYLVGIFVNAELDFRLWDELARNVIGGFAGGLGLIFSIVYYSERK